MQLTELLTGIDKLKSCECDTGRLLKLSPHVKANNSICFTLDVCRVNEICKVSIIAELEQTKLSELPEVFDTKILSLVQIITVSLELPLLLVGLFTVLSSPQQRRKQDKSKMLIVSVLTLLRKSYIILTTY